MKIRVGICDDYPEQVERIAASVRKEFEKEHLELDMVIMTDSRQFVEEYCKNPMDVVFLDIDMPGMDGFEVAARIERCNYDTCLNFITSENSLVYDSFRYNPFYFIRKEMYDEEMHTAIQKIMIWLGQHITYGVDTGNGIEDIRLSKIIYIESEGHYINIFTKRKNYRLRKNLNDIEDNFIRNGFVRSHRAYLINVRYIKFINTVKNEITLENNLSVPMSRNKRNAVKNAKLQYTKNIM